MWMCVKRKDRFPALENIHLKKCYTLLALDVTYLELTALTWELNMILRKDEMSTVALRCLYIGCQCIEFGSQHMTPASKRVDSRSQCIDAASFLGKPQIHVLTFGLYRHNALALPLQGHTELTFALQGHPKLTLGLRECIELTFGVPNLCELTFALPGCPARVRP